MGISQNSLEKRITERLKYKENKIRESNFVFKGFLKT